MNVEKWRRKRGSGSGRSGEGRGFSRTRPAGQKKASLPAYADKDASFESRFQLCFLCHSASICSSDRPLVSGMNSQVKMTVISDIAPKTQ